MGTDRPMPLAMQKKTEGLLEANEKRPPFDQRLVIMIRDSRPVTTDR